MNNLLFGRYLEWRKQKPTANWVLVIWCVQHVIRDMGEEQKGSDILFLFLELFLNMFSFDISFSNFHVGGDCNLNSGKWWWVCFLFLRIPHYSFSLSFVIKRGYCFFYEMTNWKNIKQKQNKWLRNNHTFQYSKSIFTILIPM